jgi:hypothetical protein
MCESQIFKKKPRKTFFSLKFLFLNLENFLLAAFALHAGNVPDIIWYFLEFSNFKGYRTTGLGYEFQYCISYMFLIGFRHLACSWHGLRCCAMRVEIEVVRNTFQGQMPELLPQL